MTVMNEMTNKLLLSISFSLFGMLLIFGLGFIFPEVNPYVVIKWIVIVAGAVFLYPLLAGFFAGLAGFVKFFKKGIG